MIEKCEKYLHKSFIFSTFADAKHLNINGMKKSLLLLAAICSMSLMASMPQTQTPAQKRAMIKTINEQNPNNCIVVTDMHFKSDSIPTEKTDYHYDADRNMTAMFYYEMRDTGWMCTRYEFYQSENLPNDTTSITFTHEWNYDEETWRPVSGYKEQAITNGNTETRKGWNTAENDTTTWMEYRLEEYTYDEKGRMITFISYNQKDGQWEKGSKREYAYDEDGKMIFNAYYEWQNNDWKISNKSEITKTDTSYLETSYYRQYGGEELTLTNSVYYRFAPNGDTLLHIWGTTGGRIYTKEEYFYNNDILAYRVDFKEASYAPYNLDTNQVVYYKMDDQKRPVEIVAHTYQYNAPHYRHRQEITYAYPDTNLIACVIRSDSAYSDYQLSSKTEYTYNANRLLLTEILYNYYTDPGWVYYSKKESVYDEKDQELSYAEYIYDEGAQKWHGNYKNETEYNEEGMPVSSINYIMEEGSFEWIPDRAQTRMFDVYGNFLGEGWYGRDPETGEWKNLGKQMLVYVCGDIPTPAEPVKVDPGHDFVTFAWLSYTDAKTYTLTILSADKSETIAIMNFNSFGELINTTTPPSVARRTAAPSSNSVFTCLIENLDVATTYCFIMEAKDAESKVVHTQNGTFATEGGTALDEILSTSSSAIKVIHNGTLIIKRNGHKYSVMGQNIK